jgi:hypothetical protein
MSVKQYLKDSGTVASFITKSLVCSDNGRLSILKLIANSLMIVPLITIETLIDQQDRQVLLKKAKEQKLKEKSR